MKKLLISLIVFTAILFTSTALPGVNHFIKDNSGEYVYYRDRSFTRESYIGFLTYDDLTYAARYFAPATEELPAKNIEFLFTLDGSKSYIDISGERFLTPVAQEDTEIVNYIHDLVFSFGKRRQNIGEISPRVETDSSINPAVTYSDATVLLNSGFISSDEMYQFGGKVNIYYDYLVPVFNIKKVENVTESVMEVVAIGALKSSSDRSFSTFSPVKPVEQSSHKISGKKPVTKTLEIGSTKITLDDSWTQAGQVENFFFRGDSAMLGVGMINPEEFYYYLKTSLLSSQDSFLPWEKISIIKSQKQITVYSTAYTGTSNNSKVNSFLLKSGKSSQGEVAMFSLVVFEPDYLKDKKYFTNILKSWK